MNDQATSPGPARAATDGITVEPALVMGHGPAQRHWARVGLLGIGVAALVAAAMLLFGQTASPLGTLAAGNEPGGLAGEDIGELHRGGRGGPGFGHGFGGAEITAIDGSNISLETVDDWTRTITVDGDTTYTKGGEDIALTDLAVGDRIAFRQAREDDGTWTIDAVAVVLPHAAGEVTGVDGSTITVEQPDGTSATIKVDGATEYVVNGDVAELADVEVGMILVARGTENADGSLQASDVRAGDERLRGPGGRGGHGFKFGGPGPFRESPSETDQPEATGSAS